MDRHKYSTDFKSVSKKDYDTIFSFSPELAFHFERCVGLTCYGYEEGEDVFEGERHDFVYDPDGDVTEDEFLESVDFVKKHIGPFCQTVWYQNCWQHIKKELEASRGTFIYSKPPISFVLDRSSDLPRLVKLFDRVMLDGSRTYGLTSRGKLVPLSHGSPYLEAPYSKVCFGMVAKIVDRMILQQKIIDQNNPFKHTNRLVPFGPKTKAEFAEMYPSENAEVVQHIYGKYNKVCVSSVKGGVCYDQNGEQLYGSLYLMEDGIDLECLAKECAEVNDKYRKAIERYEKEFGNANSLMAKCRREKRGRL